jgi:hypothetical protein
MGHVFEGHSGEDSSEYEETDESCEEEEECPK